MARPFFSLFPLLVIVSAFLLFSPILTSSTHYSFLSAFILFYPLAFYLHYLFLSLPLSLYYLIFIICFFQIFNFFLYILHLQFIFLPLYFSFVIYSILYGFVLALFPSVRCFFPLLSISVFPLPYFLPLYMLSLMSFLSFFPHFSFLLSPPSSFPLYLRPFLSSFFPY
jgi:hypothetical protein